MTTVLMPQATAVWLLEETSLTFEQIADFCGLHHLQVAAIANEEVAKGIRGIDPIAAGFLTREEIERGEARPEHRLRALEQKRIDLPQIKRRKGRFVPVARRQDRPDAIAWFLRNHPEVPDSAIVKLIGTTKATIQQVRDRSHWNTANIKPVDPVSLGLCSQIELDAAVAKAAEAKAKDDARRGVTAATDGPTLRPAAETVEPSAYGATAPQRTGPRPGDPGPALSAAPVFADDEDEFVSDEDLDPDRVFGAIPSGVEDGEDEDDQP